MSDVDIQVAVSTHILLDGPMSYVLSLARLEFLRRIISIFGGLKKICCSVHGDQNVSDIYVGIMLL